MTEMWKEGRNVVFSKLGEYHRTEPPLQIYVDFYIISCKSERA